MKNIEKMKTFCLFEIIFFAQRKSKQNRREILVEK